MHAGLEEAVASAKRTRVRRSSQHWRVFVAFAEWRNQISVSSRHQIDVCKNRDPGNGMLQDFAPPFEPASSPGIVAFPFRSAEALQGKLPSLCKESAGKIGKV